LPGGGLGVISTVVGSRLRASVGSVPGVTVDVATAVESGVGTVVGVGTALEGVNSVTLTLGDPRGVARGAVGEPLAFGLPVCANGG
jgi:hypothetical protein